MTLVRPHTILTLKIRSDAFLRRLWLAFRPFRYPINFKEAGFLK
jgi:hypothetical protein